MSRSTDISGHANWRTVAGESCGRATCTSVLTYIHTYVHVVTRVHVRQSIDSRTDEHEPSGIYLACSWRARDLSRYTIPIFRACPTNTRLQINTRSNSRENWAGADDISQGGCRSVSWTLFRESSRSRLLSIWHCEFLDNRCFALNFSIWGT